METKDKAAVDAVAAAINKKAAEAPKLPPLELKILLAGPGINVVSAVSITDVAIKELLAFPNLHKDLVAGAQLALCLLVENYQGILRGTPVPLINPINKVAN